MKLNGFWKRGMVSFTIKTPRLLEKKNSSNHGTIPSCLGVEGLRRQEFLLVGNGLVAWSTVNESHLRYLHQDWGPGGVTPHEKRSENGYKCRDWYPWNMWISPTHMEMLSSLASFPQISSPSNWTSWQKPQQKPSRWVRVSGNFSRIGEEKIIGILWEYRRNIMVTS